MNQNGNNPMLPYLGKLAGVQELATEIKLFQIELQDPAGKAAFADYKPGQFAFVSAFGAGEAPFGITSIPAQGKLLEFAIQRHPHGRTTNGLHNLNVGDPVGVRGPLGNCFPMDEIKGKDIIVLGGGIGGAPLRPVISHILSNRNDYGKMTILWAARTPDLLIFTHEYDKWRAAPRTELHLTVDKRPPEWIEGNEGLITTLLENIRPKAQNAISITCGPPIMIHFAALSLRKLGFQLDQMLVTLEGRMHCGIGKCGRCNIGDVFVCTDGPVFYHSRVAELLESFL
ncbi:MAG: FAD/NAD(P)-binding protein [Anaerolineales bacterium]|nr:FAD/NAD(P)-binding protein [Anaerolineales bacterium]